MKKLLTILIASLAAMTMAQAQTVAPFTAGDRVVFVGNSITDGGHYHAYIWLYYMTHFPNVRITCFNAGVGGDVIGQIADRFDADVLAKKPTVLTLTWGMNDSGYFEWGSKDAQQIFDKRMVSTYKTYALLADRLKERPGIRTILIGGSPYDETTKFTTKNIYPHKSAALESIVAHQEQSAKDNHWSFVDFFHPMTDINKREQLKDSTFSLTPNDRVHPDNDGHLVMAALFLKAQGMENKVVAAISINAGSKKVDKAANCQISNVNGQQNQLSFDYLANSLPYPLDTVARGWGNRKAQSEALKVIPFNQQFNQEMLTVKGLKGGTYQLVIDQQEIGQWSATQLAAGINMAELTETPQYQQAIQIRELNEERWDIERRLRMYIWMEYDFLKGKNLLYKDNTAAMDSIKKYAPKDMFVNGNKDNFSRARYKSLRDAWQKEMDVLTDEIYSINKPVTHHMEIKPVNR